MAEHHSACPGQILTLEVGPGGFAEKALRLVVAWWHNPSGWRSRRRQLVGVEWREWMKQVEAK